MNLSELLAYQSRKYPHKQGIVTPHETITYREWNHLVTRCAKGLQRLGVEQGDKVMIRMPNTKEFLFSYFAIHRLGALAVPINAKLIANEISYIYKHSDAKVFITHDMLFQQVKAMDQGHEGIFIKTGEASEGWLAFDQLLQENSDPEIVSASYDEDEASILYTSGTTGYPKGVVFTNKNILTVATMMAIEMKMGQSSRLLHMMPLSHSAPLHLFLAAGTYVGATHVLAPTFTPDLLLEMVEKERVTHFFGAPVAYQLTAKHPEVRSADLSSMEYWVYGGAPLDRSDVEFVKQAFQTDQLCCVYGLTEAGPNGTLLLPEDHDDKAGSIGKRAALNCEMSLVDEQGDPVPQGEVGEIVLRGDGNMKGYYKDEEKTNESLRDGWLFTGDMAQLDEDGFIWVVDRKKDIILSGGVNIYPKEIEEVLLSHPHVQDVSVVGVPHPDWGETVKAFVVQDGQLDDVAEECKQLLADQLATYKIPKLYEVLNELPRNATGKLLKNQLREQNQRA
ncbi:class I adenylate-forming enzyme family protein [Halobacillus seohaensis]|uniref:Class I adenylate-forming enzyme family protein n=1 Tax=Halobacillus seohaensis TaxID=447421 RepID=A0ABW2ESZ4_9BACI